MQDAVNYLKTQEWEVMGPEKDTRYILVNHKYKFMISIIQDDRDDIVGIYKDKAKEGLYEVGIKYFKTKDPILSLIANAFDTRVRRNLQNVGDMRRLLEEVNEKFPERIISWNGDRVHDIDFEDKKYCPSNDKDIKSIVKDILGSGL